MAKEALFNILNNQFYWDEIKFLDLFSGTGSISYEALSRGCPQVVAVDQHFGCTRFIKQTFDALNANQAQVVKANVLDFLKTNRGSYDIVFADPPYDLPALPEIPDLVFDQGWLAPDGLLVVEHGPETDLSTLRGYQQTKRYGHVRFSFFEHVED